VAVGHQSWWQRGRRRGGTAFTSFDQWLAAEAGRIEGEGEEAPRLPPLNGTGCGWPPIHIHVRGVRVHKRARWHSCPPTCRGGAFVFTYHRLCNMVGWRCSRSLCRCTRQRHNCPATCRRFCNMLVFAFMVRGHERRQWYSCPTTCRRVCNTLGRRRSGSWRVRRHPRQPWGHPHAIGWKRKGGGCNVEPSKASSVGRAHMGIYGKW